MAEPTTLYIFRCEDCGAMQAVTREGGQLLECCDAGDQRSLAVLPVTPTGDWTEYIRHGRCVPTAAG